MCDFFWQSSTVPGVLYSIWTGKFKVEIPKVALIEDQYVLSETYFEDQLKMTKCHPEIKYRSIAVMQVALKKILNPKKKYEYIKKNALITASKYTWLKRAKKIINFYKI